MEECRELSVIAISRVSGRFIQSMSYGKWAVPEKIGPRWEGVQKWLLLQEFQENLSLAHTSPTHKKKKPAVGPQMLLI